MGSREMPLRVDGGCMKGQSVAIGQHDLYWRQSPWFRDSPRQSGLLRSRKTKNERTRADDRHGKPGYVTPPLTILQRLFILSRDLGEPPPPDTAYFSSLLPWLSKSHYPGQFLPSSWLLDTPFLSSVIPYSHPLPFTSG